MVPFSLLFSNSVNILTGDQCLQTIKFMQGRTRVLIKECNNGRSRRGTDRERVYYFPCLKKKTITGSQPSITGVSGSELRMAEEPGWRISGFRL